MGATQLMRFGKNLILTRLLFPEAYGVMSIVWSVLFALTMLSDAGFEQSAIRHKRGEEPDFLNTVWTAKIIRDIGLFIIICIICYPMSVLYEKPELFWLLPLAGSSGIMGAFNSTNIYTLKRHMQYKLLTYIEVTGEILMAIITLAWAYFYPGYLALLGGALFGSVFMLVCSHLVLPGIRNHFRWDKATAADLFHFGKWILLSSIIFLIYSQGDRMLLGGILDSATLGVYSVAVLMTEAVASVISRMNTSVVYPALSRVANSDRLVLKSTLYRMRLVFDGLFVLPIGILIVIGSEIVATIYDTRYAGAGWMLQFLCVRLLMVSCLCISDSCLLAMGHSKFALIFNTCRAIWILVGITAGWHFFGLTGAIAAVSLTELPVFFVIWYALSKHKLLSVMHELRSPLFAGAGLIIGYFLLQLKSHFF